MSVVIATATGPTDRVPHGWLPLHAWSRRRRAAVAAAIAVVAASTALVACMEGDPLGVREAAATLNGAKGRLLNAQRSVAGLPALRREVASNRAGEAAVAPGMAPDPGGHAADDIRRLSQLAATTGVGLLSLEPGAAGGDGDGRFRSMKLAAQGDFVRLRAFLRGLSTLPELVTPTALTLSRSGDSLSLVATLQAFDALPAVPVEPGGAAGDEASEPERARETDPFASRSTGAVGPATLRLAGMLRDSRRVVALVETPDGTLAVQPGQALAGGRVVRIAPPEVVLLAGGVAHRLGWAEAAR